MRYVNPRTRDANGAAYLYGSSLQNTGAGPFTIAAPSSPGPFPQWWAYVGAVAVVLNLPDLSAFNGTRAYLFAIRNNGSAAASIEVRNPDASVVATVPIGEAVLVGWDTALLQYELIGQWSTGGAAAAPALLKTARFATNVNVNVAYTDGTVSVTINSGVGRTATLPVITAGDVGFAVVLANRFDVGASAALTATPSGGQVVASGAAVGANQAGMFVACEQSAGVYYWARVF